jgi:hypothetical protein
MALQHVNERTIGTLYIDDAGILSINGVTKPDALVLSEADGSLRVRVDGQTIRVLFAENAIRPEEAQALPHWDADTEYQPGDQVQHGGGYYYALPDVVTGYPPDDMYDLANQTGGWAPNEIAA